MGKPRPGTRFFTSTMYDLEKTLDNVFISRYGTLPSSGVYIYARHFAFGVIQEIEIEHFIDCVQNHAKISAETSKELVEQSEALVNDVYGEMLLSPIQTKEKVIRCFCKEALVLGKTKTLIVNVAFAIFTHVSEYVADVSYSVWEAPTQNKP